MSQINSISELLTLSGCQYRVYDIGRRIVKLSKQQFQQIEDNSAPFPAPIQGHAMLAIAFWQSMQQTPYLWFVKLPIDEQGLLNLGARNHFIEIIITALGQDLTVDPSEHQESLLKNNPYHFTPPQYKLASLNAMIKASFKQPASIYYEHCQTYFSGKLGWDQWQGIAVQGLSDFAARIDVAENESLFIRALEHLPSEVLSPLSSAIENQCLSLGCCQIVINEIVKSRQQNDHERMNWLLRMLASSAHLATVRDWIANDLLKNPPLPFDTLLMISGRCWQSLHSEPVMMSFLEALATNENEQFCAVFQDAIALAELRPILLSCIRNPDRSPRLSSAIGALFTQVKTSNG